MILPVIEENNISIFEKRRNANSNNEFSLIDAETLLMLKYRGELLKSYEIENTNKEKIFLIKVRKNNLEKLFMVEQTGKIELIEEIKI